MIISRVPASGYIFRVTFRSLSDVSYSDECRTKKALYAKAMFPLFRAIVLRMYVELTLATDESHLLAKNHRIC